VNTIVCQCDDALATDQAWVPSFQRWGIVDAIAGHRHQFAALLQRHDDVQFLRGRHPRIYPNLIHARPHLLGRELSQFFSRQHAVPLILSWIPNR
jgi:hypothetical protein